MRTNISSISISSTNDYDGDDDGGDDDDDDKDYEEEIEDDDGGNDPLPDCSLSSVYSVEG